MIKYVTEYRINKKGAECFRCDDFDRTKAKLAELRAKKPTGIYTMQSRDCRVNRFGVKDQDYMGRPAWGIWKEVAK